MVTEPTKRPRGRPKKFRAPISKRSKGRPPKLLALDPDRYFLAILQANIDAALDAGKKERWVINQFAAIRYGIPIYTPENLELYENGKPFQVLINARDYPRRGTVWQDREPGLEWHNRTAFSPYAETIRVKIRKIRARAPNDPDRRWLAAMSLAWRACFEGDLSKLNYTEYLAAAANELKYYSSIMKPILYGAFAHKLSGADGDFLNLVDFRRILIPTT
jgi:hypothetical protein